MTPPSDHPRSDPAPGPDPGAAPRGPEHVFDAVGGMPAFEAIVESFYARVEHDELLRPMYPDDLTAGKRHLALFLAQYWGGGQRYTVERGHPRLRMRHASFPITPEAAGRWALLMREALFEQGWPEEAQAQFLAYIERAAATLVNQFPHATRAGWQIGDPPHA